MLVAATVKGVEKEDLIAMISYLKRQIIKLGVKIETGKTISEELIEKIEPDVLILATGGKHTIDCIFSSHKPLHMVLRSELNLQRNK